MKHIPNIFTLLNLFFGCLAIVAAMQSGLMPMIDDSGRPLFDPSGTQYVNLPERIFEASIFIFIAAVIDFLDGFVARLMKSTSDLGKQLDSLADVVSFGVAPAIIIYQFLRLSFAQQEDGLNTSMIWLAPAFILPCAGAYRLGRFNLDTEQSQMFKGLPIPAAGLFVASFPLIYWNTDQPWVIRVLINEWFWYGMILVLSFLMVSRIPMLSLKMKNFSLRDNMSIYILLIAAIVVAVLLKWLAIPVIFILYILLSVFSHKSSTS
ncbi:MAG: CDP-diacylglycerol--serine O-phosphatidyltransferase [Flavisolibacter sp.]